MKQEKPITEFIMYSVHWDGTESKSIMEAFKRTDEILEIHRSNICDTFMYFSRRIREIEGRIDKIYNIAATILIIFLFIIACLSIGTWLNSIYTENHIPKQEEMQLLLEQESPMSDDTSCNHVPLSAVARNIPRSNVCFYRSNDKQFLNKHS
jgi:hypothetical protein